MEILTFPNSSRPGVGLKPRSEGQRPLLPQHARHCPVLEAGNSLGFLVYPPLEPNEGYQVGYEGDGRYTFSFYQSGPAGNWTMLFSVVVTLSVGSIGMLREDVTIGPTDAPITKEGALKMMRAFVVPEDMGTPQGGITLRGATNFKTPAGWDTVYLPVLNMIERPVAPMLVVRVETDWYAHESEFRYVLQPGEAMSGTHNLPIGQVLFLPRERDSLREADEEEMALIKQAKANFSREKAAHKVTTRYGLQYSPQYLRQSRQENAARAEGGAARDAQGRMAGPGHEGPEEGDDDA